MNVFSFNLVARLGERLKFGNPNTSTEKKNLKFYLLQFFVKIIISTIAAKGKISPFVSYHDDEANGISIHFILFGAQNIYARLYSRIIEKSQQMMSLRNFH